MGSWVLDYSPEAWYRMKVNLEDVGQTSSSCLIFSNGTISGYCGLDHNERGPSTPMQFYVNEKSRLRNLEQVYAPRVQRPFGAHSRGSTVLSPFGSPGFKVNIFTEAELIELESRSIITVSDLANAPLHVILSLRGYYLEGSSNILKQEEDLRGEDKKMPRLCWQKSLCDGMLCGLCFRLTSCF